MPNKKLTDSEIVKELEDAEYKVNGVVTQGFYLSVETFNAVVDLINRLQAENERLHKEVGYWEAETKEARADIDQAVAEAYKECVEKVKGKIYTSHFGGKKPFVVTTINPDDLDNLLKEMAGENIA